MRRVFLLCLMFVSLLAGRTALAAMHLQGDLKALRPPAATETPREASGEEPEIFLVREETGGKKVSFQVYPERIANTELVYVILREEGERKALNSEKPALLLFDMKGVLVADRLPGIDADSCQSVAASPGGRVLAADQGEDHRRTWHFFSYPGFAPVGRPLSFVRLGQTGNGMIWAGEDVVLVETLSPAAPAAARRGSPAMCGIRSVYAHRVGAGTTTAVFQGTDLCDYRLEGVKDATIRALQMCVKQPGDWARGGDAIVVRDVSAPLP